jgi:hypothetical protein
MTIMTDINNITGAGIKVIFFEVYGHKLDKKFTFMYIQLLGNDSAHNICTHTERKRERESKYQHYYY